MARKKPAGKKPAARSRGITKRAVMAAPTTTPVNGTHGWTAGRDTSLCAAFKANPRRAIATFAKEFGIPRGVVKARAKHLGLLNIPSPAEQIAGAAAVTRCKHDTVLTDDTQCEQCLAELEQQIADAPPGKKREKPSITVTCPRGDATLTILHKGKRGFTIVAGASPEQIYGAGPNGLPICPTHDVEMIAAEPIAAAEAFRQVAGATAPDQAALFDTSKPYNADGALVALNELRLQVLTMREVVKGDKKQLTKHQADLDTLEESLYAGIEEFMKRRSAKQAAIAEQQDRRDTIAHAGCSYELHIGKACPICTNVSRALAIAAIDAPITAFTDVTSEAHRAAAVKANSIEATRLRVTTPELVTKALVIAGLYGVDVDVVTTWSDDERLEVLRWLETVDPDHAEPPAVLGMPHLAAEPGADHQSCHDCGAQLVHRTDSDAAIAFYPEGVLVGQFCPREMSPAAPATEAQPEHASA